MVTFFHHLSLGCLKNFIAKRVKSILINLRFKLLKYKKIIRKFVILLIITSKVFPYEKGIIYRKVLQWNLVITRSLGQ